MKKIKKLLVLFIALPLILAIGVFAACGSESDDDSLDGYISVVKDEYSINAAVPVDITIKKADGNNWYSADTVDIYENGNEFSITSKKISEDYKNLVCNVIAKKEGIAKIIINSDNKSTSLITITSSYNPKSVSSLAEFKALDFSVQNYYKLEADIDFGTDSSFSIAVNNAIIDGGGHSIKNYKLNVNQKANQGFVQDNRGTIKDLKFVGALVNSGGNLGTVGIVAGTNSGEIEKVDVTGTLTSSFNSVVGGIAGKNDGIITGCTVDAGVTGKDKTGGIAGVNNGSVISCVSKGTIEGDTKVGGIAGESTKIIELCENEGKISGNGEIGGIAGVGNGTVYHSENKGTVDALTNSAGGIVGSSTSTLVINKSVNSGNVKALGQYAGGIIGYGTETTVNSGENTGSVASRGYTGGIAAYGKGLFRCVNRGQVSSMGAYLFEGTNRLYLGGIAGQAVYINQCTNISQLFIENDGSYVGGIAGVIISSAETNNNYNINNGAIVFAGGRTNNYVGGIFGYAEKGYYMYNENHGALEKSFTSGAAIIGYGKNCTVAFNKNAANITLLSEQDIYCGSGTENNLLYNSNTGSVSRG